MKKTDINLCVKICNQFELDLFLKYGLPSQLTSRNLLKLVKNYSVSYSIYYKVEHLKSIRSSPAIIRLEKIVKIKLQVLSQKDELASKVIDAEPSAEYLLFINPNYIYSDGSFENLSTFIEKNFDAIYSTGIEVEPLKFIKNMEEFPLPQQGMTVFESSALIKIAVACLSKQAASSIFKSTERVKDLKRILFKISERCYLIYDLEPKLLLVRSKLLNEKLNSKKKSIHKLHSSKKHYIDCSNDFFFVELHPESDTKEIINKIFDYKFLSKKLYSFFDNYNYKNKLYQLYIREEYETNQIHNIALIIESSLIEPIFLTYNNNLFLRIQWLSRKIYIKISKVNKFLISKVNKFLTIISEFSLVDLIKKLSLKTIDFLILRSDNFRFLILALQARTNFLSIRLDNKNRQKLNSAIAESNQTLRLKIATEFINQGYLSEYELVTSALKLEEYIENLKGQGLKFFEAGLTQLNNGDLLAAKKNFVLSSLIEDSGRVNFYRDLVCTLIDLIEASKIRAKEIINEVGLNAEKNVFSAVVWGEKYIDNFLRYTLRSLLADENIPSLRGSHIYFLITTTQSGKEHIQKTSYYKNLKMYVNVEFFIFPDLLTKQFHYSLPSYDFYRLYGALDHIGIHFAREIYANIYFIVVDAIVANGSIKNLNKLIKEGYFICANASIVSNEKEFLLELDKLYGDSDSIKIQSRDLADIGFRYRHQYINNRLVMEENYDFDKYPRELYFPKKDGLVVHALYQHPLVVSRDAISKNLKFDYFIVDSKLMQKIMQDEKDFKKLKVITDSDDVYVANFSSADRIFEQTGKPLNSQDFVSVHLESEPIHHYIFEHQQLIRCNLPFITKINPDEIAETLLRDLQDKQNDSSNL